jgi:hypothetical protein
MQKAHTRREKGSVYRPLRLVEPRHLNGLAELPVVTGSPSEHLNTVGAVNELTVQIGGHVILHAEVECI